MHIVGLPYPDKLPEVVVPELKTLGEKIYYAKITPQELHYELNKQFRATERTLNDLIQIVTKEEIGCSIQSHPDYFEVSVLNLPSKVTFVLYKDDLYVPEYLKPGELKFDQSGSFSSTENLLTLGRAIFLSALGNEDAKRYLLELPRPIGTDYAPNTVREVQKSIGSFATSLAFAALKVIKEKKVLITDDSEIKARLHRLQVIGLGESYSFKDYVGDMTDLVKIIIKAIPDRILKGTDLRERRDSLEEFYQHITSKNKSSCPKGNPHINYLHLLEVAISCGEAQHLAIIDNPSWTMIFKSPLRATSPVKIEEKKFRDYRGCIKQMMGDLVASPEFQTLEDDSIKALRLPANKEVTDEVLVAETAAYWANELVTTLNRAKSNEWDRAKVAVVILNLYPALALLADITQSASSEAAYLKGRDLYIAANCMDQIPGDAIPALKIVAGQIAKYTGASSFETFEDLNLWAYYNSAQTNEPLTTPPWFAPYEYTEASKQLFDHLLNPKGFTKDYTEGVSHIKEQAILEARLISCLNSGSSKPFIELATELGITHDQSIKELVFAVIDQGKKGFFASEFETRSQFGGGPNGTLTDQQRIRLNKIRSDLEKAITPKETPIEQIKGEVEEQQTLQLHLTSWGLTEKAIKRILTENPELANIVFRKTNIQIDQIFTPEQIEKIASNSPELFEQIAKGALSEDKLRLIEENLDQVLSGKIKISLAKRLSWDGGKRQYKSHPQDSKLVDTLAERSKSFKLNLRLLDDPSGLIEAATTLDRFGLSNVEILQVFDKNPKLYLPTDKGARTFGDFFYHDYLEIMLTRFQYSESDIKRFILKHPQSLTPEFRATVEALTELYTERHLLAELPKAIKRHKSLVTTPIEKINEKLERVETLLLRFGVKPHEKYIDGSKLPEITPLSLSDQVLAFHPELLEFNGDRAKTILSMLTSEFEDLDLKDVARACDLNPVVLEAAFKHPAKNGDFFTFAHQLERSMLFTYGDKAVRFTISKWEKLGLSHEEIIQKIREIEIVKDKGKVENDSEEPQLDPESELISQY